MKYMERGFSEFVFPLLKFCEMEIRAREIFKSWFYWAGLGPWVIALWMVFVFPTVNEELVKFFLLSDWIPVGSYPQVGIFLYYTLLFTNNTNSFSFNPICRYFPFTEFNIKMKKFTNSFQFNNRR